MSGNSFNIRRNLGGHEVEIEAVFMERVELFGYSVRLDGALVDIGQSDDVMAEAPQLLADAFEHALSNGANGAANDHE